MAFQRAKLKALVHYVCRKMSSEPEKLGKTKLNKILWYAEGRSFVSSGQQITDESFKKDRYGPVSIHLDDIIKELTKDGLLYVTTSDHYGLDKFVFVAKGDPDTSLFSQRELSWIDSVANEICYDHTAKSASDKSHDEIWQMAADHESLPIEVMLVARLAPITSEDLAWAREEIRKFA